ncbi:hypothetical protein FCI23_08840 [Actinacidiphila oryziradicis]|uniref:Uncharacterized protein n=1 Tax=Actinacidiphila oryziradicis TaxID=2571141 RepID=A0A4V5N0H1_9ACTN|nr:hypothetical protein FCI23_08840 [Actinacidiphila oryziradicis]
MDDLTLRQGGTRSEKSGTTCSGESSTGVADDWRLSLPGRPLLTIHDTRWNNGERDLVLYQPAVVPEMPAALSNLHNRRRAGIEPGAGRPGRLRIMAWLAWPGPHDRPFFKKSLTTEKLAISCGLQDLRDLTARPGVTLAPAFDHPDLPSTNLEHPQDVKPLQHAVYFPREDNETPVIAFTLFRVIPTLRHIGWLPEILV